MIFCFIFNILCLTINPSKQNRNQSKNILNTRCSNDSLRLWLCVNDFPVTSPVTSLASRQVVVTNPTGTENRDDQTQIRPTQFGTQCVQDLLVGKYLRNARAISKATFTPTLAMLGAQLCRQCLENLLAQKRHAHVPPSFSSRSRRAVPVWVSLYFC